VPPRPAGCWFCGVSGADDLFCSRFAEIGRRHRVSAQRNSVESSGGDCRNACSRAGRDGIRGDRYSVCLLASFGRGSADSIERGAYCGDTQCRHFTEFSIPPGPAIGDTLCSDHGKPDLHGWRKIFAGCVDAIANGASNIRRDGFKTTVEIFMNIFAAECRYFDSKSVDRRIPVS
jgi:hypothetical protein